MAAMARDPVAWNDDGNGVARQRCPTRGRLQASGSPRKLAVAHRLSPRDAADLVDLCRRARLRQINRHGAKSTSAGHIGLDIRSAARLRRHRLALPLRRSPTTALGGAHRTPAAAAVRPLAQATPKRRWRCPGAGNVSAFVSPQPRARPPVPRPPMRPTCARRRLRLQAGKRRAAQVGRSRPRSSSSIATSI
jgi:hypothetical protein